MRNFYLEYVYVGVVPPRVGYRRGVPPNTYETRTPELDEKAVEGSNLYRHRSGPDEEMEVDYWQGSGANMPMWGSSECSAPEEMPVGGRWGGQKHRAVLEG